MCNNNHNEWTVFPVVLFMNKNLNEMSEVLYEWPFKAVIKSLLSLVPIITVVLHRCYLLSSCGRRGCPAIVGAVCWARAETVLVERCSYLKNKTKTNVTY